MIRKKTVGKRKPKRDPKKVIADAAKALRITEEKLELGLKQVRESEEKLKLELKQVREWRKAMDWHDPYMFR